ncbi:MAG: hypothetical protein QM817_17130 [Archangium sp.]
MTDLDTILAQLDEEPWNADDLIEPLSAAQKKALHAELLKRAKSAPTSSIVCGLAQFPDDKSVSALEAVLRMKDRGGVHAEVPSALSDIIEAGNKKALAPLQKLLDHKDPSVVREAIEALPESRETTKLVLERFDVFTKTNDDLVVLNAVEKLEPELADDDDVRDAFVRNWDFALRKKHNTLMASNAIFDALIEHRSDDPKAREAFAAAAAHKAEYAQVRGYAALALSGVDVATNKAALKKLKLQDISSRSLRSSALKEL